MENSTAAVSDELVLETRDLSVGYRCKSQLKVVQEHLNFSLRKGTVTSLLGLNGSGKSTLLRVLCGFDQALSGEVLLLGKALSEYSSRELACLLGVVLTERGNAGGLRVHDLVSLGRYPYTGFFGQLTAEDEEIIADALQQVGIAHKTEAFVSDLSDGERQKVMIAKALAQKAPLIILDEPTAFLDVTSRIETMILLKELAASQGITVLLSSHDLNISLELSDQIWMLSATKKPVSGTPEQLLSAGLIGSFFDRGSISFDAESMKWRY